MVYKKYSRFSTKSPNPVEAVKIISRGTVWEKRFSYLINIGSTSYAIAKELNTDIRSIKTLRAKLGSLTDQNECKLEKITEYRNKWRNAMIEGRCQPLAITKKKASRIYKWLYRHDRDWLSIECQRDWHPIRNKASRIDWENADIEVLNQLKLSHSKFIQSGYERRITKSLLARSVSNFRDLSNNHRIGYLPKSVNFIQLVVENDTSYQVRKIELAVKRLNEDRKKISRASILTKSNLRKITQESELKIHKILTH